MMLTFQTVPCRSMTGALRGLACLGVVLLASACALPKPSGQVSHKIDPVNDIDETRISRVKAILPVKIGVDETIHVSSPSREDEMTPRIVLDVDVLTLDPSDGGRFDLKEALRHGGLALAGTGNGQPRTNLAAVIGPVKGGKGHFAARTSVTRVLSPYGRISALSQLQLGTRDMLPVPFQDVTIQEYPVKTETLTGHDDKAEPTMSGYAAIFTPKILGGGRLLLRSVISEIGKSRKSPDLQAPDTTAGSLIHEAVLAPDQTVVMATHQDMHDGGDHGLTAFFRDASGSRSASATPSRSITIVLVTPRIIASPPRNGR